MKLIERIPAQYEVQEVADFGRSYKWRPEQIVVECGECGRRMTFKRSNLVASINTCECGAESTAAIREELLAEGLAKDEQASWRPWREWHSKEEDAGIPV